MSVGAMLAGIHTVLPTSPHPATSCAHGDSDSGTSESNVSGKDTDQLTMRDCLVRKWYRAANELFWRRIENQQRTRAANREKH